jgi:hypothetical protein
MSCNLFQIARSRVVRCAGSLAFLTLLITAVGTTNCASASQLSVFPTGTTLNLTLFVLESDGSLLGGDVRGLAGLVATTPPIPSGIIVGDFGLTTVPSTLVFGLDAATFGQGLSFFLDVFDFSFGGPGLLIPATVFPQTPITDPALLELTSGPVTFGFSFLSLLNDDGPVTSVNYVLANIQVAPEPGTWVLAVAGILGFAAGRRLKTRRG